jgi:ADP-ribosylglycohydrolase
MIGAIAGDIVGSVRENFGTKSKDFALFTRLSTYTDDTVLTVAVADAILNGKPYGPTIKAHARRHPLRGFGPRFSLWMLSPMAGPYNSLGNGSAMRVSPVGHAFKTEAEVLDAAQRSAECTHNHPEGVKGAQAVALAIHMALSGAEKEQIRGAVAARFGYAMDRTVDEIRPRYRFDATCPGSVPEAIIAFLDSTDFEDALRNAVSLGGDADTQAAIAGAIAEAHYGAIPEPILAGVRSRLPKSYRNLTARFYERYASEPLVAHARALVG